MGKITGGYILRATTFVVSLIFIFSTFTFGSNAANAESIEDYTIASWDLLEVTVFEAEELNQNVRVDTNGYITFPLLGSIKVASLTTSELEDHLENLLGERYIHYPQVRISVKESGWFFVSGAVKKAGPFPYRAGISLNQAIAQAGGLEDNADQEEVQIIREEEGLFVVNIEDIMDGIADDIVIKRNDAIYIKRTGNYFVNGYIRNPGAFPYRAGTTLSQAIAQAGGVEEVADIAKIKIIKTTSDDNRGTKETILVNLKEIKENPAKDIKIRDGDTIFVPKNNLKALWKGLLFNVGLGSIGVGKTF